MPWKSEAQRRWGHANMPKEQAAEWDAATGSAKLPERAPKQREATRASGRKRGLARLTKMAGLGAYILWWFLTGCTSTLPPEEARSAVNEQALCVARQLRTANAEHDAGSTCQETVAALYVAVSTDDHCRAAGVTAPNYHCKVPNGH